MEKNVSCSQGRTCIQDENKKQGLSSVLPNDSKQEETVVKALLEEAKKQVTNEECARKALKRKTELTSMSKSHSHIDASGPGQFRTCKSESSIENLLKTGGEKDADIILIDDDEDADDTTSESKRSSRSTRNCKIARRQCSQGVSYAELSPSEESSGAEDNCRISFPGEEPRAMKSYSLKKIDAKQRTSRFEIVFLMLSFDFFKYIKY